MWLLHAFTKHRNLHTCTVSIGSGDPSEGSYSRVESRTTRRHFHACNLGCKGRLQVANQSRFGIEPAFVTPEASFPAPLVVSPAAKPVNDDVHRPLHSSKIALNAPSYLSLTIHYVNSLEVRERMRERQRERERERERTRERRNKKKNQRNKRAADWSRNTFGTMHVQIQALITPAQGERGGRRRRRKGWKEAVVIYVAR